MDQNPINQLGDPVNGGAAENFPELPEKFYFSGELLMTPLTQSPEPETQ